MRSVLVVGAAAGAAGHGGLTIPTPRNNHGAMDPMKASKGGWDGHRDGPCAGGACYWFSVGCYIGCSNCSGTAGPNAGHFDPLPKYCEKPAEPTLPAQFRTWNADGRSAMNRDWTKYHPWRAPGRAPVADPCGVAGAYKNSGTVPAGAQRGDPGSQLPPLEGIRTEWTAGGTAEVGWMIAANHGGGYLYSMCPKAGPLTEECFQGRSLPFVGTTHTIRWLNGMRPEVTIPAMDVSEGTFPAGSSWRRNPIPACNCDDGRGCRINGTDKGREAYEMSPDPNCLVPKQTGMEPTTGGCYSGTQFPAPFAGGCGQQLWGQGGGPTADMWAIVDKVRVPDEAGEYVLRWRWDTEQNPQVWTNCADVSVRASA